jgi:hypothetical protein
MIIHLPGKSITLLDKNVTAQPLVLAWTLASQPWYIYCEKNPAGEITITQKIKSFD